MKQIIALALVAALSATTYAGKFLWHSSTGSTTYEYDVPSSIADVFGSSRETIHTSIGALRAHETVFMAGIFADNSATGWSIDGSLAFRSKANHSVTITIEWVPTKRGEEPRPTTTMRAVRTYKYGILGQVDVNDGLLGYLECELGGQIYSSTAGSWWGHWLDATVVVPYPLPNNQPWFWTLPVGDPFGWSSWQPESVALPDRIAPLQTSADGRHFYSATWNYYDEFRGTPPSIQDPSDKAILAVFGSGNANSGFLGQISSRVQTRTTLVVPEISN